MKFLYGIGVFLCTIYTAYSEDPTVTVVPEQLNYWLLEGSPFKLDCVYKYTGVPEPVTFYKKDELLSESTPGLNYSISGSVSGAMTVSTITITKPLATTADSGQYTCKMTSKSSYIFVHVFTVTMEDAMLVEGDPMVSLKCVLSGVPKEHSPDITWKHNNATIEEGLKYQLQEANHTLQIMKPERADIGEYFCEMMFNPKENNVPQHTILPKAVVLKGVPKIVSHDKNKNYVQREQLDLQCLVSGYPTPKVTWKKDGALFNTSHRIHLFPYGPSPTGQLTIYTLQFEDQGTYSCEASSGNITVTAEMKIRVKDKLAALWPFLGIVAEVIVLCVIILIYEKKRSKRLSEEEDSADAVENTVDNKDVRHRRT